MVGLRCFTMLCSNAEYKNMDQGKSLGQLHDVQNWIKIYYKQSGWAYSFSTTTIQFEMQLIYSSYFEEVNCTQPSLPPLSFNGVPRIIRRNLGRRRSRWFLRRRFRRWRRRRESRPASPPSSRRSRRRTGLERKASNSRTCDCDQKPERITWHSRIDQNIERFQPRHGQT